MAEEEFKQGQKEAATGTEDNLPMSGVFYILQQINEMRNHIDQQIGRLRDHTDQQINELRNHFDHTVREEIKELRQEMRQGDEALRKEIVGVRTEMRQGDEALRKEFIADRRWRIGTLVAALAALGTAISALVAWLQ